jgi:prepilin-type N-terminal cleavage/methylation domain-containing protein
MRRDKGFTLIELMIVIAIIAIIAAIAIPGLLNSQRASNERNASGSLKTIATAQADFRSNDRDNNRVNDFWTGDIAGLYAIDNLNVSGAAGQAVKLVEVSVALADIGAATGCTVTQPAGNNYSLPITTYGVQSGKAGYWYMTLGEDLQATANGGNGVYAQNTGNATEDRHNTSRFGAAAMPESYGSSGTKVFIINEGNTMFKRDFGADVLNNAAIPPTLLAGGPFDGNWPVDADLAASWSKMD